MNCRVGIVAAEMNKLPQTWMKHHIPSTFLLIWHVPSDLTNVFSLFVVVQFNFLCAICYWFKCCDIRWRNYRCCVRIAWPFRVIIISCHASNPMFHIKQASEGWKIYNSVKNKKYLQKDIRHRLNKRVWGYNLPTVHHFVYFLQCDWLK